MAQGARHSARLICGLQIADCGLRGKVQSAEGMAQGARHSARLNCGLQIADCGLRGKVQSAEGMAQSGRSKVRGIQCSGTKGIAEPD